MIECLTQNQGAADSTSPALLRCVLEQDTFILTRPNIAERVLTGTWSNKKTSKSYHSTSYLMLSRKLINVCSNIYEIVEEKAKEEVF